MPRVAALVLAAGAGRRFIAAGGVGPKVLARIDGRPLVAHVLDLAAHAGLSPVILVVAPDSHDIHSLVDDDADVRIVVNPDPTAGMATSVATGLDAFEDSDPDVEACVVLLADQPKLDPSVVSEVMAAALRSGAPARARYSDGPGHPVVLPRAHWAALTGGLRASVDVERGARDLLAGLGSIEIVIPGPMPVDVDEPDDLRAVGGGVGGSP
jgi:CTP:molybdopterin cytidylyltransferase MocA